MKDLKTRAAEAKATLEARRNHVDHCENCGRESYEDLYGPGSDQGYTACCNEPVCDIPDNH